VRWRLRTSVLEALLPQLCFQRHAHALRLFAVHQDAAAAGGAYGILEGRTGALVHPAMMGFLLGAQAYAAYLGWQWRRARTIPEEVAALKQSLPKASDDAAAPAPVLSAEQLATAAKVEELQAERKSILASGVRETHFNWGSLLLALGVAIGVEGPVNTYLRTGKLFPGPHLYAGAAIVVLWAAAAACVPQMQKGNDTARTAHIGLNGVNMLLFLWQVPTGLEIVAKVFQFTKWP